MNKIEDTTDLGVLLFNGCGDVGLLDCDYH